MTKKIILLLVEGPTDQDALGLVFSRLVRGVEMKFDVIHGDMTSDESIGVKHIECAIAGKVDQYLRKHPFIKRNDILKVVQIVDTDGAFVPNSQVMKSDSGLTEYTDTCIKAKNKDRMIRRNIRKRSIIHHLIQLEKLSMGFSYEVYYFSRNLEHVLHNIIADLRDEEKENFAFKVADYYSENPQKFLQFISGSEVCVPGGYKDTWKFIMSGGNSLKRYCNIAVFFETIKCLESKK